jgi:hypothetical protein
MATQTGTLRRVGFPARLKVMSPYPKATGEVPLRAVVAQSKGSNWLAGTRGWTLAGGGAMVSPSRLRRTLIRPSVTNAGFTLFVDVV